MGEGFCYGLVECNYSVRGDGVLQTRTLGPAANTKSLLDLIKQKCLYCQLSLSQGEP